MVDPFMFIPAFLIAWSCKTWPGRIISAGILGAALGGLELFFSIENHSFYSPMMAFWTASQAQIDVAIFSWGFIAYRKWKEKSHA
jgi:hypothetical protein